MLRYKAAYRCYSEWLERDSSDWDTRLALARVAALAGRTMKAVDIYEQLAGEDSLDFFVNYQLARLYQQIGKTVRAIGIYDRLYQTDTTNVILLKRIGDCYNRIGWSMNAVDHYLRAFCLDPEDGETVVKAVNLMMANTVLFQAYKKLTGKQQQEVMAAIRDTNRVADLCENNSGLKAVCLKKFPAAFQQPLKNLFVYLWENALRSPKFNDHFSKWQELFRSFLTAEIESDCLLPDGNLQDFIVHLEWIALEYTAIKQFLFLDWMQNGSLTYEKIRDTITLVCRMTGYEEDDIYEYMQDCFDDVVWEWGYLAFILT